MARRASRIRLTDHCLAERVCAREEAAGHPEYSPEADAQARLAGGDLRHRILVRARHLPDAPRQRATLRRNAQALLGLSLLLAVLFAMAGVAAARAALIASGPVSIPLALALVTGPSLLALLLWLLLLLGGRGRIAAAVPGMLASLGTRVAARWSAGPHKRAPCLRSPAGPWLLSSTMHLAWLAYLVSAWITLALLLSVRSYGLAWETTLLSDASLHRLAEVLSLGPALFGVAGAESLPLRGPLPDTAREAWAGWLLVAVALYGLLPRALALVITLVMLRHGVVGATRDLHRPGYARLRERLMPAHRSAEMGTAPAMTSNDRGPSNDTPEAVQWDDSPRLVVAVETAPGSPPALPAAWQWLGRVDDLETRDRILAQIRAKGDQGLVMLVRGAAVVDRGTKTLLRELVAATSGPGALMLLGGASAARLRDWRQCAAELQIACGHWPGDGPPSAKGGPTP
ncbi:DUF2868 domain-containing protein [Algiphilus sp.]|uniref:DUF2868 domain-containing protein n=1 Tax=Algiphilus sp. TaxID=1872431 RepID=UPI003B52F076